MKVNTEELQTVGNYAIKERVSTTAVYNWIEKKLIRSVEIDGIKFIIKKTPK